MDTHHIVEKLVEHGLLNPEDRWLLIPATGGLNSSVFRLSSDNSMTEYTVRTRSTGSFASEIEALKDVADCPGVPMLAFAEDQLIVHQYLEGGPRPLGDVDPAVIDRLATLLKCLHRHTYDAFTPWPECVPVKGTRADLFRFRVRSLGAYASYPLAMAGGIASQLPELLMAIESPALLSNPSWFESSFSRLHGDLSVGNILWRDDGVSLIDWEYSRIGDPAEEFAYLLTEQPVDKSLGDTMRNAYVESSEDSQVWSRVPLYALFTSIDSALWWADYGARSNQPTVDAVAARVATARRWLPLTNA